MPAPRQQPFGAWSVATTSGAAPPQSRRGGNGARHAGPAECSSSGSALRWALRWVPRWVPRSAPLIVAGVLGAGCLAEPRAGTKTIEIAFDRDDAGWQPGFAEYDPARQEDMDLVAAHEPLPGDLAAHGGALRVSGTNLGDGLFMYWAGPVDGLARFTTYDVSFEVELAAAGCGETGSVPGEDVQVEGAVSLEEPRTQVEDVDGHQLLELNLDGGDESSGAPGRVVIGDLATADSDCDPSRLEVLSSRRTSSFRTFEDGAAWLLVGVAPQVEGSSDVYFTRVRVRFAIP
ncbi:MAG: hypothetical protein GX607_18575 [Myxococcales bacterium]|nr:hypothetical protein [Myxococcales bacterium]